VKLSFSKATLKLFPLLVIFLILVPLCWLKKVSSLRLLLCSLSCGVLGYAGVNGTCQGMSVVSDCSHCFILVNKQPFSLMASRTLLFRSYLTFFSVSWMHRITYLSLGCTLCIDLHTTDTHCTNTGTGFCLGLCWNQSN